MLLAIVSGMLSTDQLSAQLDRLAGLESGPFPVVSLYLNMQPDQRGRDHFEPFLRKELTERVRTFASGGPERESIEQDADKIRAYVADVDPSMNGLAIFTSSGADLFEAIRLTAPIDQHRLYITGQPHLYPLARVADDYYHRYGVLLADTRSARLLVVAGNRVRETGTVHGTKTKRHKMGGWSQARYQRHIENYHLQHAKEVVDALRRLVAEERLQSIILAGDEVIVPLLRDQLPKDLDERVVDVLKLDIRAPEHDILAAATELMKENEASSDRERVDALFDAYRSRGLGVVGPTDTARALELGQVDELLISGAPDAIDVPVSRDGKQGASAAPSPEERFADALIVKARQTSARVTIIQDGSLLAPVGGVGALLRFSLAYD